MSSCRVRFRWIRWAVVLLFVGSSCTDERTVPDVDTPVRVGYIPFSADLPFFVALENGYFADQGVEVEPIRFAVSSECLNATVAGQVKVAMGNSLSGLLAIAQKEPDALKIFLPMIETEENYVSHLLVKKDTSINGVEGLKGKRIGTYTGGTQLLYLRLFLDSQGLDPDKDVQIVQVSSNLQLQALEAGQYDALFTIEPYCAMAMEITDAESIVKFARGRILSPFPGGAFSVNPKFLREHPETCRKLVSALERASDFIRREPAEAKRALAKYTPVDERIAVVTGVYEWIPLERITPGLLARLQEEANLFARHRILDGTVDVKNILVRPDDLR